MKSANIPPLLPPLACDTHVHLGNSLDLMDDSWAQDYHDHLQALQLERGVLVESQFAEIAHEDFMNALSTLGAPFRGVVLFDAQLTAARLGLLSRRGVDGVRVFFAQMDDEARAALIALSPALAQHGMHLQILLNSHLHMESAKNLINRIRVPVVIDHMGWPDLKMGPDEPGYQTLCSLLGEGRIYVKLSALYRLCPPPYDQADAFVQRLIATNPDHLLWGSDWPHLVKDHTKLPDGGAIMDLFLRLVQSSELRQKILSDAPAHLYHFT